MITIAYKLLEHFHESTQRNLHSDFIDHNSIEISLKKIQCKNVKDESI